MREYKAVLDIQSEVFPIGDMITRIEELKGQCKRDTGYEPKLLVMTDYQYTQLNKEVIGMLKYSDSPMTARLLGMEVKVQNKSTCKRGRYIMTPRCNVSTITLMESSQTQKGY